jgi:glycerol uptake facilitator-like aquaporin
MEKNHGNENKLSIFFAELVGTLILSLSFNLTWTPEIMFTPAGKIFTDNLVYLYIVAGVCLYSIFYIFSPVSGGHFNPAITIGVYLSLALNAHNLILFLLIIVA